MVAREMLERLGWMGVEALRLVCIGVSVGAGWCLVEHDIDIRLAFGFIQEASLFDGCVFL